MNRRTVIRAVVAIGLVGGLHVLDFVTVYSPHLWQLYALVSRGLTVLCSPLDVSVMAGIVNGVVLSLHATIVFAVYGVLGLVPCFRTRGRGACHCRGCGHVLRGLTQAKCPECGEAI